MNLRRHFRFVALGLVLGLTTTGCSWFHRRKPQPVAQTQAPTVTEPAPTTAAASTQPAEPEPMPEKPAAQTTPAPKPKPRTTHAKKPAPAKPTEPGKTAEAAKTTEQAKTVTQASAAPPPRIVIQEGGAQPPSNQISAAMPHDEATDSQRTTQQLLDATDANLRNLRRALSADERSIVEHIRAYMQQARDAGKDGDLVRAHNLALKAHLLSDELVKR